MLMKEAQTVRCVLCHLADPVEPRPRSARCTKAGAERRPSFSRSVPSSLSRHPSYLVLRNFVEKAPFVRRMEKKRTGWVQVCNSFFSPFISEISINVMIAITRCQIWVRSDHIKFDSLFQFVCSIVCVNKNITDV